MAFNGMFDFGGGDDSRAEMLFQWHVEVDAMNDEYSAEGTRAALGLLEQCGMAGGVEARVLRRRLSVENVNPEQDGFCYLRVFQECDWPLMALRLGPSPVLSRLLVEMAARDSAMSELWVEQVNGRLHAARAGMGVPYLGVRQELREKMHECTVGASESMVARMVSVDIPDPDNFATVAGFLGDCEADRVRGVVTVVSRPVDLEVVSYGSSFSSVVAEKGGLSEVLRPVVAEGDPRASGEYGWMFGKDRGFDCPDVAVDSELYLRVSVARLRVFLRAEGFPDDTYDLFTSRADSTTVRVGVRHAAHKPDYLFGLSEAKYVEALALVSQLEEEARKEKRARHSGLAEFRRSVCEAYIASVGVDASHSLELTARWDSVDVFVGGPFTHVALLARFGVKILRVVAMAGAWDESCNLLGKQFNLAVDPECAAEALSRVQGEVFFIPTDVVKTSHSVVNVRDLCGRLKVCYARWAGPDANVHVFDWLAYQLGKHLDLFPSPVSLAFPEGHTKVVSQGIPVRMMRDGAEEAISQAKLLLKSGVL